VLTNTQPFHLIKRRARDLIIFELVESQSSLAAAVAAAVHKKKIKIHSIGGTHFVIGKIPNQLF
jgi:hypothetical protein